MKVIYQILTTVSSSEQLLNEAELAVLTKELHLEKLRLVPDCFHCLNRCGRTDDYDMELIWNAEESVRIAKLNLLDTLLRMSSSVFSNEETDRYVVKALLSLGEAYNAAMLESIAKEAKI